jgi:hypothetical protein
MVVAMFLTKDLLVDWRMGKLPHGCVHNGKACFARTPPVKLLLSSRPRHPTELWIELDFQNFGKMPKNAEVKLSPNKFTNELLDTFPRGCGKDGRSVATPFQKLANGQKSEAKVLR